MPKFEVSPEHHHELLAPQNSPRELQTLALKTQLASVEQQVKDNSVGGQLWKIGKFVAGPAIGGVTGFAMGALGVPVGSILGRALPYIAVPTASAIAGAVANRPSSAGAQARIKQLRSQISNSGKRATDDEAVHFDVIPRGKTVPSKRPKKTA